MYSAFREDQPVDEISAYLIEIFTFISIGDPRSREALVFIWKVFLLQNCASNNLPGEKSMCGELFLSSWLPHDGLFPKLFLFEEPFHNFRNGFYKESISPRVLNWPSNHSVWNYCHRPSQYSSPLKVLGPGDDSESITTIVYSINFDHHDTTNRNEQITLKYYITRIWF